MKKIRNHIKDDKAITLVALIVTIIILVILGAVTVFFAFSGGWIDAADEAAFKTKMGAIAEEWNFAVLNYKVNTINTKEMYAGKVLKNIIEDEELEISEDKVQDIRQLIKNVGREEEQYVIIYEGELYYVSQRKIKNNEKQVKWCEELGIRIWEYTPSSDKEGIKVVNGSYQYVNGIYLCTPQLNTGFVKEKTRYIKEKDGKLIPGNWLNKEPDSDWYDYKNKKWANVYVESSGLESYYVWIPRYVYKISETQSERTDVKFVDINNNYTDGDTGKVTTWNELQAQGYKIPEAFYWGDSETYTENTPLPGYWMAKYQLSNLADSDTYTIDFATAATTTTITIQDINVNTEAIQNSGKTIAKYTYAINGTIVHESTNGENFTLTGLAKGNKAVNVTILDNNGEIIGSMTKLYEVADVNPPDLTGFDKDTTFYVYWDEKGIEHNEIPISMDPPDEWYDYTTSNWANIVTRNNGLETYLVWIPRYQYALDTVSQRTYVKFILGTGTETDTSYKIPEAFTWGDSGEVQLTGYWISKYQVSNQEATPKITAEMSAGSNEIQVKGITGTAVTDGLKYEYYIDGKKVHEGKDKNENYVYSNLNTNTTYTINIIARNATTNQYVGAITQKIKTIVINPPDLTGFNENNTYYVLYDDAGNQTIGDKIKNDGSNMPKNWYSYANSKWANIVVTDGTISNGKIQNATSTTYLVWIPRYAYSLDTTNQRTIVKFLDGTSTEVEAGYKIPEAFTWGDSGEVQLKGYWISKYQLSN